MEKLEIRNQMTTEEESLLEAAASVKFQTEAAAFRLQE